MQRVSLSLPSVKLPLIQDGKAYWPQPSQHPPQPPPYWPKSDSLGPPCSRSIPLFSPQLLIVTRPTATDAKSGQWTMKELLTFTIHPIRLPPIFLLPHPIFIFPLLPLLLPDILLRRASQLVEGLYELFFELDRGGGSDRDDFELLAKRSEGY
jgi:hypothetical protein